MAPQKQTVPSHLSSPPSSPQPHQGVIRLLQHNKEHPLGKTSKEEDKHIFAPRILSKGSSPLSQHASLDGRKSLDSERDHSSLRATTIQDRSGAMRRDHSGSRTGRDGGISIINRSDVTQEADISTKVSSKHHAYQHPRQFKVLPEHMTHRDGHNDTRYMNFPQGRPEVGRGVCSKFNRDDHRLEGEQSRAGPSHQSGKLFDPRKDDPVRFATMKSKDGLLPKGGSPAGNSGSTTTSAGNISILSLSDTRSIISTSSANASSTGKEKRRRRGPSSRTTAELNDAKNADGTNTDNNSYVIELKRWYREITLVEQTLQEEHRSASERQRKEQDQVTPTNSKRSRINKIGFTVEGSLHHAYWIDLMNRHRYLAETHVAFMEAALKPGLPTSLSSLPQHYNIPTRLWQTGFHTLLERLRHVLPIIASNSTDATLKKGREAGIVLEHDILDLIIEFIYFAYTFYSNLLESETFRSFRSCWLENLGDLARYRMAVAKISTKNETASKVIASKAHIPRLDEITMKSGMETNTDNDSHNGSNVEKSSIGITALNGWELEEKEIWRSTAKEWYAKGLAEVPGTGRLHHHLGILSRDDELRSLHHFYKSLACSHPYASAKESILPLFERDHQQNRIRSDATLVELFIYLHGILYTKIQLDDFDKVLLRFVERLKATDDACFSMSTWMMMATINIAYLSQHTSAMIDNNITVEDTRSANPTEARRASNTKTAKEGEMEDDGNDDEGEDASEDEASIDPLEDSEPMEMPASFQHAAKLTFVIFSMFTLRLIDDKSATPKVNPYVPMILTFISQECKQSSFLRCIERFIPWQHLINLMYHVPASIDTIDPRKDLSDRIRRDYGPLAEDWSLRGMSWVGRKVFERGFWKATTTRDDHRLEFESEVDMLDTFSHLPLEAKVDSAGMALSEDGSSKLDASKGKLSVEDDLTRLRWKRIAYTLTILIKTVPGLDYDANNAQAQYTLTSPLRGKVQEWNAMDNLLAQQERLRLLHVQSSRDKTALRAREVFTKESEEEANYLVEASDEEDEANESEEIRQLKARRRELRKQLLEARDAASRTSVLASVGAQAGQKAGTVPKSSSILPSYTVLVLDTNVLLTPTSILESLVDSERWCVIIPLVVVTELDGITKRSGAIGQRAANALTYLESKMKTSSTFVKVQTSRGNYLVDLQFKTEEIDFSALPKRAFLSNQNKLEDDDGKRQGLASLKKRLQRIDDSDEELDPNHHRSIRSIDEVILYCLDWQQSHFMDRSAFICKDKEELQKIQSQITSDTTKAVLITLDKNLRLKARCHNLVAIGPDEIINLLEPA